MQGQWRHLPYSYNGQKRIKMHHPDLWDMSDIYVIHYGGCASGSILASAYLLAEEREGAGKGAGGVFLSNACHAAVHRACPCHLVKFGALRWHALPSPTHFTPTAVDEKPWSHRYSEENLMYKEECDYWCAQWWLLPGAA